MSVLDSTVDLQKTNYAVTDNTWKPDFEAYSPYYLTLDDNAKTVGSNRAYRPRFLTAVVTKRVIQNVKGSEPSVEVLGVESLSNAGENQPANRGHLLANILRGSGGDSRNLVPELVGLNAKLGVYEKLMHDVVYEQNITLCVQAVVTWNDEWTYPTKVEIHCEMKDRRPTQENTWHYWCKYTIDNQNKKFGAHVQDCTNLIKQFCGWNVGSAFKDPVFEYKNGSRALKQTNMKAGTGKVPAGGWAAGLKK